MIDEIANPRPVLVGETLRGHGREDDHVRRVREPGARAATARSVEYAIAFVAIVAAGVLAFLR